MNSYAPDEKYPGEWFSISDLLFRLVAYDATPPDRFILLG
jgi:hypothetical protein